ETHVVPDLGPKMYNAYPSPTGPKMGTTKLHLDAADAINVMFFSSGSIEEPGAIWDIFRREDAQKLRSFITKQFPKIGKADPIHDQSFYLNEEMLNKLYE